MLVWADGTIDNFGVSMVDSGDFLDFQRSFRPQTKEYLNPALHPEVIVNYTIIPEPETLGLIGFVAAGFLDGAPLPVGIVDSKQDGIKSRLKGLPFLCDRKLEIRKELE